MPQAATSECSDQMSMNFSALGRMVRRFPRLHLALSAVLAITVVAMALSPESGESHSQRSQTVTLPKPEPRAEAGAEARPVAARETAPTPAPARPAPVAPEPDWIELEVQSGDTLSALLQEHGVTAAQVHRLVNGDDRLAALARIRPGETLGITLDDQGELNALRYHPTRVQTVKATLGDDGRWQVKSETREYQRQVRFAEATIDNSLFLAGHAAGMSDNLTMQLANIFGWDIDFVLDIRNGDRFRVLYEELYLDGEKVGVGNILAAEFWTQGRHLTAYRFETRSGDADYFDSEGRSMRKEFIRTPVAFSRISSRFSLGRKHPILNKVRAHRGIDYAAPSGTPIKAAGKGKVIFAGVKGGYGNVLILKHGQRYSTLYAHMRGFARGIRVGSRVNQGQTIGYVGMSGLATGPHLHYEFRVDGVHRNPQTVPLPKAQSVTDNEKPQFLVRAKRLEAQMTLFAEAATLASSNVL